MERAPVTRTANVELHVARTRAQANGLERRTAAELEPMTSPPPFVFSYPGPIGLYVFGKHRYPRTTVADLIIADLVDAGSTDTVIEMNRNGTVFATITILAGLVQAILPVGQIFRGRYDYAQAEVTAAGAGATELSLHVFTTQ